MNMPLIWLNIISLCIVIFSRLTPEEFEYLKTLVGKRGLRDPHDPRYVEKHTPQIKRWCNLWTVPRKATWLNSPEMGSVALELIGARIQLSFYTFSFVTLNSTSFIVCIICRNLFHSVYGGVWKKKWEQDTGYRIKPPWKIIGYYTRKITDITPT